MSEEGLTQIEKTEQGDTGTGEGDAGQGASGDQAPISWMDSLPEELKGNEDLKQFKDPSELAKALIEAKGKIQSPPEGPDSYQVTVPENFPVDNEFLKSAKAWAHQAGLSQAQFEAFARPYIDAQASALATQLSEIQKGVDGLKVEWGPDFDSNDKLATQAVRRFGGDELLQVLIETGMAKNPIVVKTFLAIGKAISEDKLIEGDGANIPQLKYTDAGNPMLDYSKSGM